MADFDKVIKLLAQTDGRDKIYKFLAGLCKILAAVEPINGKSYDKVGKSIGSARSLMRMGKFIGDVPKLQKIIDGLRKNGVQGTELKKFIEFFRILGNSLYIIGDNAAFIAKHNLIPANATSIAKRAKLAQFWGFFLASVLDLIALHAAVLKKAADASTSTKESKAALINLAKDGSDTLVAMAAVGYLKSIWHPNAVTAGALTCVSGGVATYLNWKKVK